MAGRPRLPEFQRRKPISVWLTPQELRQVFEAARVNQQTASDFIRDAMVGAAMDCLEPMPDDMPGSPS